MAYDDEIRIKTAIDNSELDKGLKAAQSKIKGAEKTMSSGAKSTQKFGGALKDAAVNSNGFTSGLANAAKSGGAFAAAIAAGITVAKKYIEGIRETSEAFKVQQKAELELAAAAKNNPYLSEQSVKRLKEYAGELQQVSNIGDETAIKVEAQLAATGRTEEEIIKIMKAAADYSAATGQDIASAAQALNATYSGMTGTLGRQLGAVKELTAEQLKNGEAIDVVAKAYKGMAKATLDARTQAQNAKGDFAEALGKITKPTADAWDNLWKGFYEGATKAVDWFNEKLNNVSMTLHEGGNLDSINSRYTNEKTGEEYWGTHFQSTEFLESMEKYLEAKKSLNDEQSEALFLIKDELAYRERIAQDEKQQAEAAEKKRKAEESAQGTQSAKDKYTETIRAKEREIELRRKAGEEISREQAAQEMYSAKVSAFMELAKGFKDVNEIYIDGRNVLGEIAADGEKLKSTASAIEKISELAGGAEASANRLLQDAGKEETLSSAIQAAVDALKEQKKLFNDNSDAAEKFGDKIEELEELLPKVKIAELQGSIDDAKGEEELSKVEELEKQKERLKEQYAAAEVEREQLTADERLKIEEGYEDAMAELNKRITAAEEEENRQRLKNVADMVSQINGYVSQTVTIMQDASNLMLQTVQNETDAELATLEAKYLKGEIGEEEYEEAKLDAKKKAAKEEYKIQMFQWSASILQATANIAQGVAASLSQGVPVGLITGTLCAAAGAVQIASIIASKPVPPSFAGGGIVPGTSYTGDNVRANVNSGEMILNATQQRSLWELANGRRASEGGGANITINNSASNIVSARPQVDKDKIVLTIDARVNDSLQNGRYDKSLTMANQGMGGEFYGI